MKDMCVGATSDKEYKAILKSRGRAWRPHDSHNMPYKNRWGTAVKFDNACAQCGLRMWGRALDFDYDSALTKPCRAAKEPT